VPSTTRRCFCGSSDGLLWDPAQRLREGFRHLHHLRLAALVHQIGGKHPHAPDVWVCNEPLGREAPLIVQLTDRERQVLASLANGLTAGEVARRHGVSVGTVRSQIKAVLRKLDVHSQVAAIALLHRQMGGNGAAGPASDHEPVDGASSQVEVREPLQLALQAADRAQLLAKECGRAVTLARTSLERAALEIPGVHLEVSLARAEDAAQHAQALAEVSSDISHRTRQASDNRARRVARSSA